MDDVDAFMTALDKFIDVKTHYNNVINSNYNWEKSDRVKVAGKQYDEARAEIKKLLVGVIKNVANEKVG
jgi:hypothetical protein